MVLLFLKKQRQCQRPGILGLERRYSTVFATVTPAQECKPFPSRATAFRAMAQLWRDSRFQ